MILVLDIGNSQTVLGICQSGSLTATSRLETRISRPAAEIAAWLDNALASAGLRPDQVRQSVLSSVVPDAVPAVAEAVRRLTGRPLLLASRENIGLDLQIDKPESVGTDRLLDALAAANRYPCPLAVFDLGTATTLSVLDGQRRFIGGAISPGLQTAADSLHRATAQLPAQDLALLARQAGSVEADPVLPLIGRDTAACIRSGIVHGTAAMIDGLAERLEQEIGQPLTFIMTGGYSGLVRPLCRRQYICEPDLLLLGLADLAARSDLP